MSLSVYYHLYAAGEWREPASEFLAAFVESRLSDESALYLGLVGRTEQRDEAYRFCSERVPAIRVAAEADEGWEQVTLSALRRDPAGDPILYCHTKGAAVLSEWNDQWRRSMVLSLVDEWRLCLPWLETVETVGCHWVDLTHIPQQNPFWGGNMWWARRSLIERLGVPAMGSRYDAEAWIGTVRPTYHDMRPGFPSPETIRQEARGPNPHPVVLSADGMRWRTE